MEALKVLFNGYIATSVSAAHGYAPIQFQQRPLQNGPIPAPNGQQTHEMNIPNDLIGCIIGRGGQKINEIRLVSVSVVLNLIYKQDVSVLSHQCSLF